MRSRRTAAIRFLKTFLIDLSRNRFAPLIWCFAIKEKHHGTEGTWDTVSKAVGDAASATKSGANSALDVTVETTSGWMDSIRGNLFDDEAEQLLLLIEDQ